MILTHCIRMILTRVVTTRFQKWHRSFSMKLHTHTRGGTVGSTMDAEHTMDSERTTDSEYTAYAEYTMDAECTPPNTDPEMVRVAARITRNPPTVFDHPVLATKRRAYDAINVLVAAGVISRPRCIDPKRRIRPRNVPTSMANVTQRVLHVMRHAPTPWMTCTDVVRQLQKEKDVHTVHPRPVRDILDILCGGGVLLRHQGIGGGFGITYSWTPHKTEYPAVDGFSFAEDRVDLESLATPTEWLGIRLDPVITART